MFGSDKLADTMCCLTDGLYLLKCILSLHKAAVERRKQRVRDYFEK